MKLSIRKLVNVGFGVAVLILCVVGVVAFRGALSLVETTREIERTQTTLLQLGAVISLVKDAETGQRGYIITGEERYLDPYLSAVDNIDRDLRRLRLQMAGEPEQLRRLARLDTLIDEKFAELGETVELRRSEGFERARAIVRTDRGAQAMQDIRQLVREMQEAEADALEERSRRAELGAHDTMVVTAAGTLLAFVLLGLATLMINRDIGEQRRAEEHARHLIAEQAARAEAEAAERRSRFLAEASGMLSSSLEIGESLENVARLATSHFADLCVIDLVEQPGGDIARSAVAVAAPLTRDLAHQLQRNPPDPDASHGVPGVLRSQKAVVHPELTPEAATGLGGGEARELLVRELGLRTVLIVPLVAHGRTFGVLSLIPSESDPARDEAALRLTEEFAHRVALAVENARLYQRARQATRARDDVLAIVSHDLRNPVHTISMATELLRDMLDENGGAQPGGRRQLEIIGRQTQLLSHLIRDLLDAATIERGTLSTDREPHDSEELAREAVEMHQPLAAQRSVQIEMRGSGSSQTVFADRERILQVFSNLIGNAIKFSPESGQVVVGVEERGDEVAFSVSDSGPGIVPDHLPHLFDRYWQAQRSARAGAGLGLAIAKGIVEAHDGRIWVDTRVGAGSTFYFTVPTATSADGTHRNGRRRPPDSYHAVHHPRHSGNGPGESTDLGERS